MKRILIKQYDSLLADICTDLSKFQKTFTPVVQAYSQLEIGPFDDQVFTQVISENSSEITDSYRKSLDDHLEATLVKNAKLKAIVLAGSEEAIGNFLRASRDFIQTDTNPDRYGRHKDRRAFLTAQDLSFNGTDLFISPETKESLLEKYCRLYVESDNDHLVYAPLVKMQSALQDFRNAMFDLGLPMEVCDMIGGRGYLVDRHIREFFTCGEDKIVNIKPESVRWAASYKVEKQRMRDMYNKK